MFLTGLIIFTIGMAVIRAEDRTIENTIRCYFEGVLELDIEKAETVSLGKAKTNLQNLSLFESDAEQSITDLKVIQRKIITNQRKWFMADVQIEFISSNLHDVRWFGLEIIKTGDGYKVINVFETPPTYLFSDKRYVTGKEKTKAYNELELTFKQYADSLVDENENSLQYLIGPARQAQLKSITRAPCMSIYDLHGDILHLSPETATTKFLYKLADNRDVMVLVFFYKMDDMWKIANISVL